MAKLQNHNGVPFGRRKVAPCVCIADIKAHIRDFLREALEDIDFVTCDCDSPEKVADLIATYRPDLFIIGLSGGGIAANAMLESLQRINFDGKVLVFGAESSPMTFAIVRVGEELGLSMLPLLPTPFSDVELRARTAALRLVDKPPNPPVDLGEALHADTLELWYQPKIDSRSLSLRGAEAMLRLRHPTWGTVPPAYFLPEQNDPHFSRLSKFVIAKAAADWNYFCDAYGPVDLSINLPLAFIQDPAATETLAREVPRHPAFDGMIVEFKAADVVADLPSAVRMARQLQLLNVAVAIDNVAEEWPSLLDIDDFPFVEIKIDRQFVNGCADDRLKQWNCRRILELADGFGARTVAEGVETRGDFIVARELGFDMVQGYFLARPMERRKFARRTLGRPFELQN